MTPRAKKLTHVDRQGRITMVGNAAGSGARMSLLSGNAFRRAGAIARGVEYLELAGHQDFNAAFIANSRFR